MNRATAVVAEIVGAIEPFDERERDQIGEALRWLASTDDVFRRVKPDTPPRHLVSYTVLVDGRRGAILLGRHRLAGLWLPAGGHVDPGEHPLETARREADEEMGIPEADFGLLGAAPVFLTITPTHEDGHEDVSLWYVLRGDSTREYVLDPREFDGGQWWDIDSFAITDTDPSLPRFLKKLTAALAR
ncbi:NUDIX domain-containing protein [Nocardia panacis]|uniref:NUDIX domain-containing protein n=1 Tax=Nocardia panacis TaxID=2340916 RepID=A0A3A4KA80_9NOCA|nr:NUDIX domain-containing protein [Nocardia panacis]RJO69036.1 NUDIX domain-containing protein [Nocardia panacis]